MNSVISYPDRGPWGSNRYRGNCSGHVIEAVVRQYMPASGGIFVDACMGSGTSRDVIADKFPKVRYLGLDLNPKANPEIGSFDFTRDSIRKVVMDTFGREADICFSHPPYGPMIKYSGNVWGSRQEADTSQCSVPEFLERSQFMLANQRDAVREGGYYMTLIGDWRNKGRYYSFQADFIGMMPQSELRAIIIKTQHNCVSDGRSYNLRHPRIMHEYLLVWEKALRSFVQAMWEVAAKHKRRMNESWANMVRMVMVKLGEAPLETIYREVEKVAGDRLKTCPTWQAQVRKQLQHHCRRVQRGIWAAA